MHSLVDSCICSNQLSYPARALHYRTLVLSWAKDLFIQQRAYQLQEGAWEKREQNTLSLGPRSSSFLVWEGSVR